MKTVRPLAKWTIWISRLAVRGKFKVDNTVEEVTKQAYRMRKIDRSCRYEWRRGDKMTFEPAVCIVTGIPRRHWKNNLALKYKKYKYLCEYRYIHVLCTYILFFLFYLTNLGSSYCRMIRWLMNWKLSSHDLLQGIYQSLLRGTEEDHEQSQSG